MIIFFFIHTYVFAQINPTPRFAGMGNTGTALHGLDALTLNQAGVAALQETSIAFYYQEHFFNVDIRTQGLLFAIPTKHGVFGLLASQYGIKDAYSELKSGLTYARAFGPRFSVAMNVNYHQLTIPRYGSSLALSVEVGMQYALTDNLIVGGHLANPANVAYDNEAYAPIPVQLRFGAAYKMSKEVLFTADVEQQMYHAGTDVKVGLEYRPISWMSFRGGILAQERKQSVGFGLLFDDFTLDMAVTVHPRLGISPQLMIAYVF